MGNFGYIYGYIIIFVYLLGLICGIVITKNIGGK